MKYNKEDIFRPQNPAFGYARFIRIFDNRHVQVCDPNDTVFEWSDPIAIDTKSRLELIDYLDEYYCVLNRLEKLVIKFPEEED